MAENPRVLMQKKKGELICASGRAVLNCVDRGRSKTIQGQHNAFLSSVVLKHNCKGGPLPESHPVQGGRWAGTELGSVIRPISPVETQTGTNGIPGEPRGAKRVERVKRVFQGRAGSLTATAAGRQKEGPTQNDTIPDAWVGATS